MLEGYGITERFQVNDQEVDCLLEDIRYIGFGVLTGCYSSEEVESFSYRFDACYRKYIDLYGYEFLESIDENYGIRLPLALDEVFVQLAMHPLVLRLVGLLIKNKFILNQQNAVINPPKKKYNQSKFHRDLPYQHFISSRPIGISVLYCVDEFTKENGGTIVVPGSHRREEFPSDEYVKKYSLSVEAPAGSYIIFDSMLFHKGGYNNTTKVRRAVNHVFTIPLIKQQIHIPSSLNYNSNNHNSKLTVEQKEILGFTYPYFQSPKEYLLSRREKAL